MRRFQRNFTGTHLVENVSPDKKMSFDFAAEFTIVISFAETYTVQVWGSDSGPEWRGLCRSWDERRRKSDDIVVKYAS
jgi:hypothetical protein